MLGDTRNDLAGIDAGIDSKFQQFLGLSNLLGSQNGRNANIHLLEIVERTLGLLRLGGLLGSLVCNLSCL